MQALLLTSDASLVNHFNDASMELGIQFRSSENSNEVCDQFKRDKYEAIVIDFETIDALVPVLKEIKNAHANERAVIFAIASNSSHRNDALRGGVHFVIHRPIQRNEIRETFSAAYDLMYSERRRYFRCAVILPARVKRDSSGAEFVCTTMNLSSNGVALRTPIPLKLAETVQLAVSLPDGFVIHATGIVIWDDKHGKCGLRLQCRGPAMRAHLDSWLDLGLSKIET
jgi:DNA-binding response OmpR family regulator